MKKEFLMLMAMIAFAMPIALQGQAPGYLGKRHLLGGGIHINARNVLGLGCTPNWNGNNRCFWDGNGGPGFSLAFNLAAEKAVSRRLMLGLGAEVYGTGTYGIYFSNQGDQYLTARVLGTGLSITTKFHSFWLKGLIAPYGGYFAMTFQAGTLTEHRLGQGSMFASGNVLGVNILPSGFLSIGYHIFLGESLVLDLGLRCGTGFPIPVRTSRRYNSELIYDALGPRIAMVNLKFLWLK